MKYRLSLLALGASVLGYGQGTMTTIAGTKWIFPDGVPALDAPISGGGVAVDSRGTLYIGDCENGMVQRLDSQGRLVIHAGTGDFESGDGGPARKAGLFFPCGVATDARRNVYITGGQTIRRVDLGGYISTAVGEGRCGYAPDGTPVRDARLVYPSSPAFDSQGRPYFIEGTIGGDCNGQGMRVRMVDDQGRIRTVGGYWRAWL